MNRGIAADRIVAAVIKEFAGRSGCDIEEIVDDPGIFEEIKFSLWVIIDEILFDEDGQGY